VQTAAEVQTRIHSLEELGDVVGALRSVSAARVQQAHTVLDSVRQYTAIIQDALSEAARAMVAPPTSDGTLEASHGFVISFGSEHGFVGAYNDRVLEHAALQREERDELFVVGTRSVLRANERRDRVSWSCAMATQIGGIDEVALRIAERLGQVGGHGDFGRVILVYTRSSGGSTWRIVTETLLPFDLQPYLPPRMDRPRALSNLQPRPLLDGLITELLFAQLAHAATESFASENAARLASMDSASDNVTGKLVDLRGVERELRQEEITTELLDVVTGAEAITNIGQGRRDGT